MKYINNSSNTLIIPNNGIWIKVAPKATVELSMDVAAKFGKHLVQADKPIEKVTKMEPFHYNVVKPDGNIKKKEINVVKQYEKVNTQQKVESTKVEPAPKVVEPTITPIAEPVITKVDSYELMSKSELKEEMVKKGLTIKSNMSRKTMINALNGEEPNDEL